MLSLREMFFGLCQWGPRPPLLLVRCRSCTEQQDQACATRVSPIIWDPLHLIVKPHLLWVPLSENGQKTRNDFFKLFKMWEDHQKFWKNHLQWFGWLWSQEHFWPPVLRLRWPTGAGLPGYPEEMDRALGHRHPCSLPSVLWEAFNYPIHAGCKETLWY